MKKQRMEHRVGVGASSVLFVLTALAMAALALLAYGQARNTASLATRNVEMTTAYYEADSRVQAQLALIDAAVARYRTNPVGAMDASWFLTCGVTAQWRTAGDGVRFAFTVPAGDGRVLAVEGTAFARGDRRFRLDSYRLQSDAPSHDVYLDLMEMY